MARNRSLVQVFTLLTAVTLALLHASAQGRGSTPARTPDGKPDLSGTYSFSTVTPLQRPDALAGKATLTDEEAAAFEAVGEHAAQPGPVRSRKGPAKRRLCAAFPGRRAVVQRVLVRARQQADPGQAHVAHRRSSGRTNPAHGCRATPGRRDAAALGLRPWRLVCRPASRRPVPPGVQLRPTDDAWFVQQQRGNRAGAGSRRHRQRDGAQLPGHPDRRAAAHHASPVVGRLPWPLGRRHARGRNDQLPARDEPAGLHREHEAGGTLHASRRRDAQVRIHRHRSDVRTPGRGPRWCR